jgi:hypothetical protein
MGSSFISCAQAKSDCAIAHAGSFVPYIVQYFPQSPPACAAMTAIPGPLMSTLNGDSVTLDKMTSDLIGMESYHPAKDVGDEKQPDFSKGTVAIQSDTLGNTPGYLDEGHVDENPDNHLYALGDWKAQAPDADGFCSVPTFSSQAVQKLPLVPAVMPDPMDPMDPGVPCVPGVDITYAWQNLQVYVTAAAQGTQFTADLTYTQVDHTVDDPAPGMCNPAADQTCTVNYKVRGMWPEVFCGVEKEIPDPMDPTMTITVMEPDDEFCCPDANPDPKKGRPVGSGINPDFPTKCDPDLLLCVLDAEPDAKLPILGGSKLQICKDLAEKNK